MSVRTQQGPHSRVCATHSVAVDPCFPQLSEISSIREHVKIGKCISMFHGVTEGLLWKAMGMVPKSGCGISRLHSP